jgi:hypothetical protein
MAREKSQPVLVTSPTESPMKYEYKREILERPAAPFVAKKLRPHFARSRLYLEPGE